MEPWQRLCAFAEQQGVEVVFVPAWAFKGRSLREVHDQPAARIGNPHGLGEGVQLSPFSNMLAISRSPKKLFISRNHLHHPETIGGAIHELGHILALREEPRDSVESDFLGWEWLVAKHTKLLRHWDVSMKEYGTKDASFETYGELPPEEKRAYVRAGVKEGRKYGNISADGRPVSVR